MRISDWSSDVSSSDLQLGGHEHEQAQLASGGGLPPGDHRDMRAYARGLLRASRRLRRILRGSGCRRHGGISPAARPTFERDLVRSEEGRVGKACVSKWRLCVAPEHEKKKK